MRRDGSESYKFSFSMLQNREESDNTGFEIEVEWVRQIIMWTSLPCFLSSKTFSSSLFSSPSFLVFCSHHIVPDHDLIIECVWWHYYFVRILASQLPVLVLNLPFNKPEHLSVLLWRINSEVKWQWQNYTVILLQSALYHQATAWDCRLEMGKKDYKRVQSSKCRLWKRAPLCSCYWRRSPPQNQVGLCLVWAQCFRNLALEAKV